MTTETRTFVSDTAAAVGDGYAGLRLNRTYKLQVEWRDHNSVAIKPDYYENVAPDMRPLVLTREQFEKWLRK